MNWKTIDFNAIETITILPYCDCYEIAIKRLAAKGYDEEKLRLAEESDILGNVPFMVFGCSFRAKRAVDIHGEECYYLMTSGYRIPLDFVKKV